MNPCCNNNGCLVPYLAPPPGAASCIAYPNALGEKEWHCIRKESASESTAGDENECCMYERNVKSCDPCILPQAMVCRMYAMPTIKEMRPAETDEYSPETPPSSEALPPSFNYKEDAGECNKRETRGPGYYPGAGFLPTKPLYRPDCVPCGYHFSEAQGHVYCTSGGGPGEGGGGAGSEKKRPLLKPPPPPSCPCPPVCPPPCPCPAPCSPCMPCLPCGSCGPYCGPWRRC